MTLPIFPGRDMLAGLTYSSKWSPAFFNLSDTAAAGASIDIAIAAYPLHDFELTYAFLRDAASYGDALSALEFRTMMGFHLATGGTHGRFLYRNPDDFAVTQQPIGTGNGATTTFTLVRTFGANGYFGTEPIGQVDEGALFDVYLDGSASPVDPSLYTLDASNPVANTVTFDTAPADGEQVAVDMSYFYYCKLAENSNTFEKFMNRAWMLNSVKLHSCRAGA